jgi:hypothetical protein
VLLQTQNFACRAVPGGPGEVEYAKQLVKMMKLKKAKVIRDE